ncbi:uncharacterized protein A4U43_C01F24710 [Asparagus officinalis]|uniref:Uncharacterized protein n=1 Tax=Asparagus officinalis TaxID=4686 RepID=A0A5P1FSH5_ASPOF|nr:embryo-specific protein ATS3B-like [Asparagus officinalis]ONK81052.1 uncharacterized protein A4U43_C01F24710 [Asparagus officinalis]
MGLTSAIIIFSLSLNLFITSLAEPVNPHPQEFPSFKIQKPQDLKQAFARACSYMVRITTSCSSPRYTRDYVSISFGDAYGNQVYVPRLDDPSSGTFERCSTDTFKVQGPCGYGVCYVYLYRSGYDGWIPDSVTISDLNYRKTITFYYRVPIPAGVWYGFNHCGGYVTAAANATEVI